MRIKSKMTLAHARTNTRYINTSCIFFAYAEETCAQHLKIQPRSGPIAVAALRLSLRQLEEAF